MCMLIYPHPGANDADVCSSWVVQVVHKPCTNLKWVVGVGRKRQVTCVPGGASMHVAGGYAGDAQPSG